MALPVSSAPPPPDVAMTGWTPITVRVTWTLLGHGLRVRPQVLRDARDHVLFHLEPSRPLSTAEDLAEWLTHRFVARAKRRVPIDPWPQDLAMPVSPRWRRVLERSFSPLSEAVFRYHYGDGRSLAHLEKLLEVDAIALEAGRAGLREVVRRAGVADGLPLEQWSSERLDALLHRLAIYAPGPCPPALEVTEGCHRDHVVQCPRCDRLVRLIRAGILSVEDLLPPSSRARPQGMVRVLALQLHPHARHHLTRLAKEAGVSWFPLRSDAVLLDAADQRAVEAALRCACELGVPRREHLRGVVLKGPGRWSRHGLLGPLVERSEEALRKACWGVVGDLEELPEPLPPLPSARRWWAATGVATMTCLALLALSLPALPPAHSSADQVAFTVARGGIWTEFDVSELAVVNVVRAVDDRLEVVLESSAPSDKIGIATGDGTYRLHVEGEGVLLVIADEPVPDLADLAASWVGPSSLSDLAASLEARGATTHWVKR